VILQEKTLLYHDYDQTQLHYHSTFLFDNKKIFYAYGPKNQPFVINDINCTGQEKSLQQCNYIKADSCQSGMYASVICTNYIPSPESGTRIKVLCTLQFSILADFGILIKYFLIVK
jgi:hypothetical protein